MRIGKLTGSFFEREPALCTFSVAFLKLFFKAIVLKLKVIFQIAQQHGIQALRDNPEMMGTSVPMLRRAASILQQLCKVPACRQHLIRHQQRLLQFTMSHLVCLLFSYYDLFFIVSSLILYLYKA